MLVMRESEGLWGVRYIAEISEFLHLKILIRVGEIENCYYWNAAQSQISRPP
jgi:hypothetical protein